MDYTLVIDQGNTASKATVFHYDKVVEIFRYETLTIEGLCPVFEQYDIKGVVYCTVVKLDVRLVESLRHINEAPVLVMTHETELPIAIDYRTPQTLGLDRVAAAVAAAALYPGEAMMVADAGTALTIDVVDAASSFRGGNISPGISLRFKALHEFTGALPLVEVSDEVPDFGYDTTTAIRSGVVNGVVEELKGSFAKAKQEYGCKKMVLTGGDAPYLMSQLAMNATEVVYHPDLVAEGLNRILRYNENN